MKREQNIVSTQYSLRRLLSFVSFGQLHVDAKCRFPCYVICQ